MFEVDEIYIDGEVNVRVGIEWLGPRETGNFKQGKG
jgi:hypothetical protein